MKFNSNFSKVIYESTQNLDKDKKEISGQFTENEKPELEATW